MEPISFDDLIAVNPISRNMTGVAGEYFVCAELCRINILALLTPKNNPLFDIVATNPKGKKSIYISVKTMGVENNQGWRLGMDMTVKKNDANLYVVLVNLKLTGENDYYIYLFDELVDKINGLYEKYISVTKKDGSPKKDIKWRVLTLSDMRESDQKRKNNWRPIEYHLR